MKTLLKRGPLTRAFTLIELLVVIAIIAILAAILFPVFAQAKQAAKQTGDVSGLRQVGTSWQIYLSDFDDVHPPLYYVGESTGTPSNFGLNRWPWLLQPYVKSFDLFFSPADAAGQAFNSTRAKDPNWGYLFGLGPSWGYNQQAFSPEDLNTGEFRPINATSVSNPSNTLLLASSYWGTNATSPKYGYYRLYPPAEWAGSPPVNGLSYGHVWPRFRNTHVSVLYPDNHVKVVHLNEVRKPELWNATQSE